VALARDDGELTQRRRCRPSLANPPRERGLQQAESVGDALMGLAVAPARHRVRDKLLSKLDTAHPPVRRRTLSLLPKLVGQLLPTLEEKVAHHEPTFAAQPPPVKTGQGEELPDPEQGGEESAAKARVRQS
jgi:hypothetical protein